MFETPQMPAIPEPPPMPLPAQGPQGQKPGKKSTQTTFLGTTALPTPQQVGTKTLLGQ